MSTILHRLAPQYPLQPFNSPSLVYGHMIELAMPILKDFFSDLYYDAGWVKAHLQGTPPEQSVTFHYYVSDMHTWLGLEDVDHSTSYPGSAHWRLVLHTRSHAWYLEVTALHEAALATA